MKKKIEKKNGESDTSECNTGDFPRYQERGTFEFVSYSLFAALLTLSQRYTYYSVFWLLGASTTLRNGGHFWKGRPNWSMNGGMPAGVLLGSQVPLLTPCRQWDEELSPSHTQSNYDVLPKHTGLQDHWPRS